MKMPRKDDDPCTRFEERAAILEFLAGYPRAEAERRARVQLGLVETATQSRLPLSGNAHENQSDTSHSDGPRQ